MTAQSREIWSKQALLKVAKLQTVLFWIVVMNFLVAAVCLGPILAVAAAAIGAYLSDLATNLSAASPLLVWLVIVSHSILLSAAMIAKFLAAVLSYVPWGLVIPPSIILSSLITIFCNHRLAAAVRASAAWHYINPVLMITAAVTVAHYYGQIAVAFAASEPRAYFVLVLLSLLSLGALFPVVRLDSAATSLLDRHGIAFGALGAKMDGFEPHDIRRYRCPKCQVELLPEQEFWDGAHPRCIKCGTVGERLPASGATAADVAATPAR